MTEIVDIRAEVVKVYARFRKSGWRLAQLVAQVYEDRLWQGWGFSSAKEWAREDLPKIAGNLSKYRQAGEWLASLSEEDATALIEQPIWPAIEAMPALKAAPAATLELVKNGASSSRMRQHVAKTRDDLHLEPDKRSVRLGDSRTVTVDKPVLTQWERVMNLARFQANMAEPSMGMLLEWVAAQILLDPNILDPQMETRYGRYGVDLLEEILQGRWRCVRCGSWDARQLEGHHLRPRSQGGADGPVAMLCMNCHAEVHQKQGWREFAESIGIDPEGQPIPAAEEVADA